MLKFLSYLSVQQENSSFCYRFEIAIIEAYLMWRRRKTDWSLIDRILKYGDPQFEDPQERLFVESVHTPIGSYKVFSAFYLTHKFLLSQLLFLSQKGKIDQSKLALVYTILEISNVIADRYKYSWNICGEYNAENVYTSNYKEYGSCESYNCLSDVEIKTIFAKHKVDERYFQFLILSLRRSVYEKEISRLGYCDTFELHPFLRLNSGEYLVLFPANLLRLAYRLCYSILVKEFGEKNLFMLIEDEMIQETGFILQSALGVCVGQNNYQNIPFLWLRFDEDKVANVAIVLSDKRSKLDQAIKDSEDALNNAYPNKTIFTFLVTQAMAEEGLCMTVSRDITHFSMQHRMPVDYQQFTA